MTTTITLNGRAWSLPDDFAGRLYAQNWSDFWSDVAGELGFAKGLGATSSSSLTVGEGSKELLLDSGGAVFAVGAAVRLQRSADAAVWMVGTVDAQDGAELAVTVTQANGAGSFDDWVVGPPAPGFATPLPAAQGGTGGATPKAARAGLKLVDGTALVIAAGTVTPTGLFHRIDTEGAAASDDLDIAVATNCNEGDVLTLVSASAARTVYVGRAGNFHVPCLLQPFRPTRFILIDGTWYPLERELLLDDRTVAGPSSHVDLQKGIGDPFLDFRVEVRGLRPGTNGAVAYLRWYFGGVLDESGSFYGTFTDGGVASSSSVSGDYNSNEVRLSLYGIGNLSSRTFSCSVQFTEHNTTRSKIVWGHGAGVNSSGLGFENGIGGFNVRSTANLDGIRVLFNTGSIEEGRIMLYGNW